MPEASAVSTASTPAPSATEFESAVGEFFGDYTTPGESPEPEESAAGTTPAEPASGTADGASDPAEPKAGADAAETPSEGTTPDAAEPVVEDDPFKDTTPAQYVINGQAIPVEDIRVFKEGGAVIRPEALPNVLAKLAERDTLSERVRTRDAEYTTLSKVSEWTDAASNKSYSGPEAVIEMRIGNASLFAENQLLLSHLTDPAKLAQLLTTEQVSDGKGGLLERVILSPAALATLQRENTLTQREAAAAIREHYKTVMTAAATPAAPPIDFPKASDALVKDLATSATLDASVLTSADRAMLAKQLPFHIKDGQVSVEWQDLVKDRITLRTEQKTASATLVPTITNAVKQGQAAMAAAARGVRTPVKPVVPARPVAPQSERAQNEGDAFDALLTSGASAMRAAR